VSWSVGIGAHVDVDRIVIAREWRRCIVLGRCVDRTFHATRESTPTSGRSRYPVDVYMLRSRPTSSRRQKRNLSVDNRSSYGQYLRAGQVTAEGDAIHSFAMRPRQQGGRGAGTSERNLLLRRARRRLLRPMFGALRQDHAFMPIEIHVVSAGQVRAWAAPSRFGSPGAYKCSRGGRR